ncbi:MAG: hypothetical protein LAO24_09050 [Acidobacteriia bacterium]|nr:hypothetical protein [Terriglobia bacterium]
MSVKFTLRGRTFDLRKEDIVSVARGMSPGRIQKYSVVLNGKSFPIRQIVAAATTVPAIEITSQDAYRILQKFGFDISIAD